MVDLQNFCSSNQLPNHQTWIDTGMDQNNLIPLFYYDPAKGEYVPIDPDASFDAGTYLTVEGDVVQDYDSKATPATRGSQVSY